MIVDAGTRSSGEVRIGFSPAFDKYHEATSTKVESKVQEGGGEFCEQATLKSGGVFGWSNQRRDKEPIMGNLTNFNGISGGGSVKVAISNQEFQTFNIQRTYLEMFSLPKGKKEKYLALKSSDLVRDCSCACNI